MVAILGIRAVVCAIQKAFLDACVKRLVESSDLDGIGQSLFERVQCFRFLKIDQFV